MQELYSLISQQLKAVSLFGDNLIFLFFSFSIVFLFLYRQKHLKTALIALLTSVSYLYSLYLKQLFRMPRPLTAGDTFYFLDVYGFPSSHVVFYTTFWGFVIYLTYKYTKEAKLYLHVLRWLAIYLIISIGASRVALGMHSLKDIVAGYFFGIIFLVLLIWLDRNTHKIFPKNKIKND